MTNSLTICHFCGGYFSPVYYWNEETNQREIKCLVCKDCCRANAIFPITASEWENLLDEDDYEYPEKILCAKKDCVYYPVNINCVNCGSKYPNYQKKEVEKYCVECGKKLHPEQKHCSGCGTKRGRKL